MIDDDLDKEEARGILFEAEKDLTGKEIKDILINKLSSTYLINSERMEGGWGGKPFDIILGKERFNEMIGLEIKGDTDNFSRLSSQLDAYTRCFNAVYLVVHKHQIPVWIPENIGVIRIYEDGRYCVEKHSVIVSFTDVCTDWDWEMTIKANHINAPTEIVKRSYEAVADLRKNVLFNRFFAKSQWGDKEYTKFYPLSDYQKQLIIGFNVEAVMKKLEKDIKEHEKRLELIKKAIIICNSKQGKA